MTIAWCADTATSIASHPRSGPKIICLRGSLQRTRPRSRPPRCVASRSPHLSCFGENVLGMFAR